MEIPDELILQDKDELPSDKKQSINEILKSKGKPTTLNFHSR